MIHEARASRVAARPSLDLSLLHAANTRNSFYIADARKQCYLTAVLAIAKDCTSGRLARVQFGVVRPESASGHKPVRLDVSRRNNAQQNGLRRSRLSSPQSTMN